MHATYIFPTSNSLPHEENRSRVLAENMHAKIIIY